MAVHLLEITTPKTSPIPACSPNLMPFHISYTGPAPLSTYFRVKQAPKPEYGATTTTISTLPEPPTSILASDSQATLVDSETQPSESASTSQDTLDEEMIAEDPTIASAVSSSSSSLSNHLVAAFRGRTVRGLTVDLPAGYTGVVFTAPPDQKGSSDLNPNETGKPHSTRRNTRQTVAEKPDLAELGDALDEEDERVSVPVRSLEVSGTFESFVLWNADVPVDVSRDEYLRSLTEWTRLATVVHEYDQD
ncbi:ribonuclease H2, subunit C [Cytidiella melzeri]|nr:ribonuclease H2, subunit C [Cytidiella melzeri]